VKKIQVQKLFPDSDVATLEQLPARRDWMDETPERHAYMCFPLNLTNRLGWGLSFPEDIRFIWDGITDTTPDHVKVLEGEKFVTTYRGNATVSFTTGLKFTTDAETSILAMPVPNKFVRGAQAYTSIISTSFYYHMLPLAWRLTEPNVEIHIPAGTPVASILPISLTGLQDDYELCLSDEPPTQEYWQEVRKYGDVTTIKNGVGDWSKMYRDALDYNGDTVGAHETKSIKLNTVTCPFTGQTYEVEETEPGEESNFGHA
tara:strand:+ start:2185 stop:2961 length:777 start_codon:yes stop_codon:yes gene_type:complete